MSDSESDWMPVTSPQSDVLPYGTVVDHPDLYDLLFGEYAGDIEMYRRFSEHCATILECGIGTGRVAIPLARLGKSVVGIDSSEAMLARLSTRLEEDLELQERVIAIRGDMRSFDLSTTFDLVICPFMTFNYLMSTPDQCDFLAAVRKHLNVGGRFVFELMTVATLPELFNNDGLARNVFRRNDGRGRRVAEMSRVVRFDSSTQVVEQDRHYRLFGPGENVIRETCVTWRNRIVFIHELELLLLHNGFVVEATFGNHECGPYTHHSQFLVVTASAM